jgi:hypothetical protein
MGGLVAGGGRGGRVESPLGPFLFPYCILFFFSGKAVGLVKGEKASVGPGPSLDCFYQKIGLLLGSTESSPLVFVFTT